MAFFISPSINVSEVDLTTLIPSVFTSIGVMVLRDTYKGPELKKQLVTTQDELIDIFGEPTSAANCYRDVLNAVGFLKNSSLLYCTRAMPDAATFAGTKATSGSNTTFTANTTGDAYDLDDFEDPDEFHEHVNPTNPYPFYLIANSRGAWGNNVRVAVFDKSTWTDISSGGNSSWTVYSDVADVDTTLEDDYSFLVVVQEKEQNEDSWTNKEYFNVSMKENSLDDQGVSNYAENKINQESDLIRISLNPSFKNQTITISTREWQQLGGGRNSDSDSVTDAAIQNALDLYDNSEEIDVNLFIDADKSDTIKQYMISICETRKDCFTVLDCKYSDVVNNRGNEATDLRNYRLQTLNESTSYAAIYGNWLYYYDKWNQTYRWIPTAGFVAGSYALTDSTTDVWFAPAGPNRGLLRNIKKLAWNPNKAQRDILYKNGINPIASFSGRGKMIFGQKTMLSKESAFNRVNVRRLFIALEKAISTASFYFLFEQNDAYTRLQFVNTIEPFLQEVKGRRGIYDYAIVCDERNNTSARIDRNEMWSDIYIKPTKAVEFIQLNFIATRTGASFEEIIGQRTLSLNEANDLV